MTKKFPRLPVSKNKARSISDAKVKRINELRRAPFKYSMRRIAREVGVSLYGVAYSLKTPAERKARNKSDYERLKATGRTRTYKDKREVNLKSWTRKRKIQREKINEWQRSLRKSKKIK